MIEYRRLNGNDADNWLQVRLRALQLNPEAFGDSVEETESLNRDELKSRIDFKSDFPQQFVLGAFEQDALVGIHGFRRERRDKSNHKGYIWGMFVAPEARGQGVGKAMLSHLIDDVREIDGIEQVHLWVSTTSPRARSLYTAMGFERVGTEHRAMRFGNRYIDLHQMVLYL
jgi:ribosomal protein S18 acetylase RimI-like enzyme